MYPFYRCCSYQSSTCRFVNHNLFAEKVVNDKEERFNVEINIRKNNKKYTIQHTRENIYADTVDRCDEESRIEGQVIQRVNTYLQNTSNTRSVA